MSTDIPFDQARKEASGACEPGVRACLRDFYDVPDRLVVSAEHGRDGAYETGGDFQATDFLDYAGIDWLVDARPAIVPVGERLRPNEPGRRDFSLRLDNGVDRPCEADRLPAGLSRGLSPEAMLFGWRSAGSLERAWMLDCEALVEAVTFDEVPVDERATGDGTRAGYITIGALADAGCILESWEEPPTPTAEPAPEVSR